MICLAVFLGVKLVTGRLVGIIMSVSESVSGGREEECFVHCLPDDYSRVQVLVDIFKNKLS